MHPRQTSGGCASYSYHIELQGEVLAIFSSCVGLHSRTTTGEDVLVLESGTTDSLYIWEWYSRMLGGKPRKQPLTIVQKNDTGEEIRWRLQEAWPVKWNGQALSIDDDKISIYELGISHMGAERES